MIDRITGKLIEVHEDTVVVDRAGIAFVVAVPRYAIGELSTYRGHDVTLHTFLFLEGNQVGGRMDPVLVGFLHPEDKVFFRRFISVKGIGWRKALKALSEPIGHVAAWIENADVVSLKRLSGVGARGAELIVAELKGKMDDIAVALTGERVVDTSRFDEQQRDALEVMVALGDGRPDAERWLERAMQLHVGSRNADEWIRVAYRVKTGVEG